MSTRRFTVKDFMTPSPHAIEPHELLSVAHKRLQQLRVSHLPVRAAGKPVGILSERDVSLMLGVGALSASASSMPLHVEEVMTPDPYCVRPDQAMAEVAAAMAEAKIGSALVTDSQGALVGIFTVTDALKALATII